VNLDYTDIRSPIDGRTAYTLGNLVNPASGILATIVKQDPIYVLFPVSVRDLEIIYEARQREGAALPRSRSAFASPAAGNTRSAACGTSPTRRLTSRPTP
jgi:multidrug efflux pump subunit AcrA (membrane-fusion protein)